MLKEFINMNGAYVVFFCFFAILLTEVSPLGLGLVWLVNRVAGISYRSMESCRLRIHVLIWTSVTILQGF